MVQSEQQESFHVTFLLLLGQGFPGTFHGAYQGGKGLVPAVPAESSSSAFSTHLSMRVKNHQTPFDKMFCLLVREKIAKCAGMASKSELWELLGENQDTRVQATQQIPLQNKN